MELCINCGAEVREGANFCGKCGTRIKSICTQCGCNLLPDDNFCPKCGAQARSNYTVYPQAPDLNNMWSQNFDESESDKGKLLTQPGFYWKSALKINASQRALLLSQQGNMYRYDGEKMIRISSYQFEDFVQKDNFIYALKFDWKGHISLCLYSDELILCSKKEIFSFDFDEEIDDIAFCMNSQYVFFVIKNRDNSYSFYKYSILTEKTTSHTFKGINLDSSFSLKLYANGEKLYFKHSSKHLDADGDVVEDEYFTELDTVAWKGRNLWKYGEEDRDVPSDQIYLDFSNNIVWTFATKAECRVHQWSEPTLIQRSLDYPELILYSHNKWTMPMSNSFSYFDGELALSAREDCLLKVEPDGSTSVWYDWPHTETDSTVIWNNQLIIYHMGFRVYDLDLDHPIKASDWIGIEEEEKKEE